MSVISRDPSYIHTSRNQGLSSLVNGVAMRVNPHDQSNDFHSMNSSTV
jgi:hypothetical protein